MKKILLILLISLTASCTVVKNASNGATQQAKGNLSVGFSTEKVEQGYEVNGFASTNIFGIEPYASFKAGLKYNPKKEQPSQNK
jgi:hypothetical protein